ncbi:MAG: hypothetical protein WCO54_01855 [Bacteroidota bacterium]
MKNIIIILLLSVISFGSKAQHQLKLYDSFKKDAELKEAILKFDMTPFMADKANFVCDTVVRVVDLVEMNKLLRKYLHLPKNAQLKKASESNNGYTQTFGIYKDDDAISYIRFTISQTEGTLEEVFVEKNN